MIPNEQETLRRLDEEPRHRIKIRRDKNNASYVTERVYVNGVCIQIPVGEDIEVPRTVKELLERKEVI